MLLFNSAMRVHESVGGAWRIAPDYNRLTRASANRFMFGRGLLVAPDRILRRIFTRRDVPLL
jgi:hypothetical protein